MPEGMAELETPPLGIMPKRLHDEMRMNGLRMAIQRYLAAQKPVPTEWISEWNVLAAGSGDHDG